MGDVAGAVLAAGAGTRMGQPKATLDVGGVRLLDLVVMALREAGCDPIHVVVRPDVAVSGARRVVNPDPARGMRSSLDLAIEAAAGAEALAVVLVDTPGLTAASVRSVIAAWQPGRIAIAVAKGQRAHPTVMSPDLWREALAGAGPDEGARGLLAARPDLVDEVEVDADPTDLDTPADLARWLDSRP